MNFGNNLQNFYENKNVLPSWKFLVDIVTDGDSKLYENNKKIKKLFSKLRYHHIVDVSIPMYRFTQEKTMYGPVAKTFPVLNHEGFDFKIAFEDDNEGNVMRLIHYLQQTVVRRDGIYNALNLNTIGKVFVHLYNHNGIGVCRWTMNKVYFLGTEDLNLSYKRDDIMTYNIHFGCDVIKFEENDNIVEESETQSNTKRDKIFAI